MSRGHVSETRVLLDGFGMGESPRWHEGRLWFSNWGTNEIVAVDVEGNREVIGAGGGGSGWAVNWLRDGRMLVTGGELLRVEPDGSRVRHADLRHISPYGWSEITVDGRGNAYVNSLNFDFADFTEVLASGAAPGKIALVTADGTAREVADGLAFPNGMAVTPDNGTLIVAESFAARLTAFDIAADGSLSNRRVWADVTGDGICLDAEGAVWCSAVGGDGKRRSARPRGRRGPRPHRGRPSVLRVHARWRGRPDAVHGRRPVVRSRPDGRAHRGEDRSDPHRPGGGAARRLAVRRRSAAGRAIATLPPPVWAGIRRVSCRRLRNPARPRCRRRGSRAKRASTSGARVYSSARRPPAARAAATLASA